MPSSQAHAPVPRRVLALVAASTFLTTTAYYATPDVIRSRRARAAAKTALLLANVATSIPLMRAERAARPEAGSGDGLSPRSAWANLEVSGRGKAAAGVGGGAALLATTAGITALERWIFRHGEARRAAGKTLPHTGPALVYGALAALVSFVPDVVPRPGSERS